MPVPRRTKQSRKQEQAIADRIGGRVTPGSGNGWVTKNDVKADDLSVEAKYTDKKSYSLKHEELLKAHKQALMDGGRECVFVVGFADGKRITHEYAVISMDYFETLRGTNGHPE